MQHKRLTSILLIVALGTSVLFAQDPNRIPPSVEKYRKERVGPLSGRQPDPEETARVKALEEHQRKLEGMKELRRTGRTSLSQAEIDDFLEACGFKRGVKFDNVPVCLPGMPVRPCGRAGVWLVLLQPSVRIADVDSTIQSLETRYGVKKMPEFTVDYEKPSGVTLVMSGDDAQAAALSQDPLVRLVGRDRILTVELYTGKKRSPSKLSPTPTPTPTSPKKADPEKAPNKKIAQSIPYQLDRIDQRNLPYDQNYFAPNVGAGVDIYHVGGHPWDGHTEFLPPPGGNRTFTTFVYYDPPALFNCDFAVNTISQHDTGVLSIAASRTFGVAPAANLVAYAVYKPLYI